MTRCISGECGPQHGAFWPASCLQKRMRIRGNIIAILIAATLALPLAAQSGAPVKSIAPTTSAHSVHAVTASHAPSNFQNPKSKIRLTPSPHHIITPSTISPPVTSLAFSPDGRTLAVGTFRQVQLWDVASGRRERALEGAADSVTALAFAPGGAVLAAGGGEPTQRGEVLLFDVKTGTVVRRLGQHTDVVYGLAYSPDGTKLVTASGDKTLRIWDTRTGAMSAVLKDHADSVYAVACSPDGSRIVSTGVDRSIKVWDARTGKPLFTFSGRVHNDTAYALAFSPDGSRLLSAGGDKVAKMWTVGGDADSTREFRRLAGHEGAVHCAAFSPDGMTIATGGSDRVVNLWTGVGGGWLRSLTGAADWIYAVAIAPDNAHVAAGTYDGTVLLWRIADGVLERTLATRLTSVTMTAVAAPAANAGGSPQAAAPKPAEPVLAADGFQFPEGPAYDGKGNVFVSNCNSDYIGKLDAAGRAIQFKAASDRFTFEKTNGLTFFEDGSLFACDFGRKAIVQIFPDGRTEAYADKCGDEGFKGPNDLAFDPAGNLYFTDPVGSSASKPTGCVYRIERGSRKVTRVVEGIAYPNGIAFSADAKTLYIAESERYRILKARVKPDGSLKTPQLFCQMPDKHTPDGMNFDQAGNLYVATVGPGLVSVIDKEGKIARTIKLPGAQVTNVEFGGKELKTLYITEAEKGCVYKLQVEVGGLPLFRAPNNTIK